MKKPMATCSSYIHVSQTINRIVHFDSNWINPSLILHKTTYSGVAKMTSEEFSLWLLFQGILRSSLAILQNFEKSKRLGVTCGSLWIYC